MTVPMQFKEVTIRLGFWEDADGFGITEEQWREWLKQSVISWNHKKGPHFSVKTATHTQEVYTDEEMGLFNLRLAEEAIDTDEFLGA